MLFPVSLYSLQYTDTKTRSTRIYMYLKSCHFQLFGVVATTQRHFCADVQRLSVAVSYQTDNATADIVLNIGGTI